ncbi:hypothetical protein GMSM_34640 [Geomonas sp. Red276]
MAGNAGLTHVEDALKLLHGEFAAQQNRHQTQAAGIGQSFKNFEHRINLKDFIKSGFLDITYTPAVRNFNV